MSNFGNILYILTRKGVIKVKPSIKDVARVCNVSTTTVSLVLNDKPNRFSEETKTLIRKVAAEMNYRPNLLSRSLVTKKLGIIGLIVPSINVDFYGEFSQELITNFEDDNYMLLGLSNYDPNKEKSIVLKFLDYGVKAIILCGSYRHKDQIANEAIQILAKSNTPFLVTGAYEIGCPYTTLNMDHIESGYIATRHLLELGHRRIGFISQQRDIKLNDFRLEGYKNALADYELELDQDLIVMDTDTKSSYILDHLLTKDVTGALISGEQIIYNLYKRANEINIIIPEDISIVAFGNSYIYDYLFPRLTSVAIPTKEIARDMNQILKELVANTSEKRHYCYKPVLIIRDSTQVTSSTYITA